MLSNIILCISAKQAIAGIWRMGSFVSCTRFANDEAGLAKFKLYISSRINLPIHIIVDAVEEDYRIDYTPHSSGQARAAIIQRRLSQIYRTASFRSGVVIGRETDNRKDDRILLMALTNAELLAPWINIIEEAESPLAGAYMIPMVSQLLARVLKLKQPHLLLMTHQPAGLRQTYIAGQTTRLSRLNSYQGNNRAHLERLYLTETEKTRLYLTSLRIITRETPMHLVYLAIDEPRFDLVKKLEEQQGITAQVLSLETLAKKTGLKAELLARYPELLHMHALARGRLAANLLPEAQIKNYRLLQLRRGINGTTAGVIAVGAWLMLGGLSNVLSFRQQTQAALEQTQIQEKHLQVAVGFPRTLVSGSDLKTAADLADKLGQLSATPGRLMQALSQELEKQPELAINRIRWKQTEDAGFSDVLPGSGAPVANTFEQPPPRPPDGLYEIGFVDGQIRNFSGDYRAALESIGTFAKNLKKNKEVSQVKIILQPINTSSRNALLGNTLDQQSHQKSPALFRIKVFLRPATAQPAIQQVKP